MLREQSDDLLGLFIHAVRDYAIFALDPEGYIVTWNSGAEHLKGYRADEIVGSHFSRFYTPEDVARGHPAYELRQAALHGVYEEEGWRVRKDGTRFWANVVITALKDSNGKLRGFGKVTRDLTARKLAEQAHLDEQRAAAAMEQSQENERIFDQIFSESPSFMALLSVPDYRYLRSNAAHSRVIQKSNIIGKLLREVEPELEGQGIIRLLDQVVATGQPFVGRELEVHYAATAENPARTAYLDFVFQPLRRSNGEIYAIATQGFEVTERVLNREAVENERENFRNLFKQTPEMVCILRGPDHVFEFVNEAHIRVLGFDATGMAVRVAQPESVEVHGILDEVYRTGQTAALHEIPVTVTDRLRYFNLTYAARRDDAGQINGIMILGVEVTEQVLARERLRSQQAQLDSALRETQALLGASSSFFALVDPKTKVLLNVNDLALDVIGRRREEIVGQVFHECPWWKPLPASAARIEEAVHRASEGSVSEFDLQYWSSLGSPQGQVRWTSFRAVPFRNSEGIIERITVSGVDINERKYAEEALAQAKEEADAARRRAEVEREKLKTLFMEAPAAINVYRGPEHVFELCNRVSQGLLNGRDPTGQPARDAVPEILDQGFLEILDRVYQTGEAFFGKAIPLRLRQPDGSFEPRYFDVSFQPWHDMDGRIAGVLNVNADVTAAVKAREHMARLLEQSRRSEEAAREAVRVRDEFMSIASHELKTPLTSLLMQTQIRQREVKKGKFDRFAPERLPRLLQDDDRQLGRLARLVDDMLDVSRIANGKLTINVEQFDLAELVRDVVSRFGAQIESSGSQVSLSLAGPVTGCWDRFRIEQVFLNLLTNALKYGEGKPIAIGVRLTGNQAELRVTDHGMGIAAEDRERIFGQFERAVSSNAISGLGLGLFITRQIVERHGGAIRVDSEPGAGSTFRIDLPLQRVAPETGDGPSDRPRDE